MRGQPAKNALFALKNKGFIRFDRVLFTFVAKASKLKSVEHKNVGKYGFFLHFNVPEKKFDTLSTGTSELKISPSYKIIYYHLNPEHYYPP